MLWKGVGSNHSSSLLLKPSPNLELLVNHLNNATSESSNDPENVPSSRYCGIDEMHHIKIPPKN